MAERKIIWSRNAINERRKIYNYWTKRNHSKVFSEKLHQLFLHNLDILRIYPETGILIQDSSTRYIVVRDYLLFYNFTKDEIQVLKVWDGRRDPEQLQIVQIKN